MWFLLFFDVLGSGPTRLLPIPHKVGQAMTQGALVVALGLALTINPKGRVRSSVFLGLYTLLGVTSLMSSIRFIGIGTDYRAFRLLGFLAVLWLLTPWWGRRDLLLLGAHMRFLAAILVSTLVGLALTPGSALGSGRLEDAVWPVPPPQVAHYSAVMAGLALVLWLCGLMRRSLALLIAIPSFGILLLTHTRTALVAALVGLLVAGLSLFTGSRRVRRAFTAILVIVVLIGVPFSSQIVGWMSRGENSGQLTSLTGRTNFWSDVFSAPRPEFNVILGDGLSNGAINDPANPGVQGLPIDSSWVEDYQDQGLAGDVFVALMFITLLVAAALRPRGPPRALALFLIVYCLIASFTEDGAGIASQYALDMAVAASLLAPSVAELASKVKSAKGAGWTPSPTKTVTA